MLINLDMIVDQATNWSSSNDATAQHSGYSNSNTNSDTSTTSTTTVTPSPIEIFFKNLFN